MGKTILNKYTGDFDGFNDGEYEGDIENINNNNSNLEDRVTINENHIGGLNTRVTDNETDITNLDTRVTTLEGETGLTQSVTVKDGTGTNINLNFTNGKLTSIT